MTDADIIQNYLDTNGLTVVPINILKVIQKKYDFEIRKKDHGDYDEWVVVNLNTSKKLINH